MDNINPAAYVIVGGLITAIATLGVALFNVEGEKNLDSRKRTDNRQLARDEYQRMTLVALQAAVIDLARGSSQMFQHDLRQYRATGKWGGTQMGDDLNECERDARQRVATLKTNVDDDETRVLVEALLRSMQGVIGAKDEATADSANLESALLNGRIMEQSGALIRATFIDPTKRDSI